MEPYQFFAPLLARYGDLSGTPMEVAHMALRATLQSIALNKGRQVENQLMAHITQAVLGPYKILERGYDPAVIDAEETPICDEKMVGHSPLKIQVGQDDFNGLLHWAATMPTLPIFSTLVKHNVCPLFERNTFGRTPLHILMRNLPSTLVLERHYFKHKRDEYEREKMQDMWRALVEAEGTASIDVVFMTELSARSCPSYTIDVLEDNMKIFWSAANCRDLDLTCEDVYGENILQPLFDTGNTFAAWFLHQLVSRECWAILVAGLKNKGVLLNGYTAEYFQSTSHYPQYPLPELDLTVTTQIDREIRASITDEETGLISKERLAKRLRHEYAVSPRIIEHTSSTEAPESMFLRLSSRAGAHTPDPTPDSVFPQVTLWVPWYDSDSDDASSTTTEASDDDMAHDENIADNMDFAPPPP